MKFNIEGILPNDVCSVDSMGVGNNPEKVPKMWETIAQIEEQ